LGVGSKEKEDVSIFEEKSYLHGEEDFDKAKEGSSNRANSGGGGN